MTPLIYFLTLAISILGLGMGIGLAYLAVEELGSIRKYLVLAKKLLLGGLLGLAGYVYSGGIWTSILFFALGLGLAWFVHEDWKAYLVLGCVFFACSYSPVLFPLAASLILLYGFVSGTLVANKYMGAIKKDRGIMARKASAAGLAYAASAGILYLLLGII